MKAQKPAPSSKATPVRRRAPLTAKRRRALIIKSALLVVVVGICVALGLWTTYLADKRLEERER